MTKTPISTWIFNSGFRELAAPILLSLALGIVLAGCSQNRVETLAPQAPAEAKPEPVAVTAANPGADDGGEPIETRPLVEPLPMPKEAARKAPSEPGRGHRQILIDSGEPKGKELTLLEASQLAKARKATAAEPVAVITDENLKDYAARGKLTMAEPSPAAKEAAVAGLDSGQPGAEGPDSVPADQYWTDRLLTLRQAWHDTAEEIDELKARAEQLRTDFYSADDPRHRDTRIKPAWDRVLDRIEQARRDVARYEEEVGVALEEGRRAGALPGWLRAGVELEPPPAEADPADLDSHDSREPTILGEPPR